MSALTAVIPDARSARDPEPRGRLPRPSITWVPGSRSARPRMMVLVAAWALAACGQPAPTPAATTAPAHQERVASLAPECPETPQAGFEALDCRVAHGADNYMVHFAAAPREATGGQVSVEAGAQTLSENNVSEYLAPRIEDVDGDGADDVLIARESGNANVNYAFWRNVAGHYVRLGELSGVEFERTADGYLAVPARGGAADWDVAFYRVDAAALTPLVTLALHAEADDQGHVTHTTCSVGDAPGLGALHLTRAAAQAKFCAEPAAKVFD